MARIRSRKKNIPKSLHLRNKNVWRSEERISWFKRIIWNTKKTNKRKWLFNKIKKRWAKRYWKEKIIRDRRNKKGIKKHKAWNSNLIEVLIKNFDGIKLINFSLEKRIGSFLVITRNYIQFIWEMWERC